MSWLCDDPMSDIIVLIVRILISRLPENLASFLVVVINPSYLLTSGAGVIKGVNKYFFCNSLARLVRHDFVIFFFIENI